MLRRGMAVPQVQVKGRRKEGEEAHRGRGRAEDKEGI